MTHAARRLIIALACLGSTACSLTTVLRKNLDAISASTATISANSDVVKELTKVSKEGAEGFQELKEPLAKLGPSLGAVAALERPMIDVAALRPDLNAVAGLKPELRDVGDLKEPMTGLVKLQPSLDATAALSGPMERVAMMQTSLDNVAALEGSLAEVAALHQQLEAVADLKGSMQQLAALQEPLDRVAALQGPMMRLASMGTLLERPFLLTMLALLGLAAWGLVTFLAVHLAMTRSAFPSRG